MTEKIRTASCPKSSGRLAASSAIAYHITPTFHRFIRLLPERPSLLLPPPWLSRQQGQKAVHHEFGCRNRVPGTTTGQQGTDIFHETRVIELVQKVALELSPGDVVPFMLQVAHETGHNPLRLSIACGESCSEIKQVSPFLTLIESPELGPEELVKLIGRDGGGSGKPARLDGKGLSNVAEHREMFAGVDLKL